MLNKNAVTSRILILMGSLSSQGICLNSIVAELASIDMEKSGLEKIILVTKNIRGTLEQVLKAMTALILDMETHQGEFTSKAFGQKAAPGKN